MRARAPRTPRAVCWLAAFFSALVTGEMPVSVDLEPEFLAPLENHTVTQGRDVHFTCSVNHLSHYRVAWIKSDTKAILAIHSSMVAVNPRLSVTYNNHNTWRLHVANVQANDSGTYMCQVNTDPMKSQMGQLSVVIPPDIADAAEGGGGGSGAASGEGWAAREGGSVRLACAASGVPPPSVVWKRDAGRSIVFRHDGLRVRKAVSNYSGDVLLLTHVQRTDMGSYYCIASNGVPPAVSRRYRVHVHFFPSIKVSNQLVGAPLGSDVVLQCYVEASPKAMNSWYRDNGDKLLESAKYHVSETTLNEYSLWMNLTIRGLERRDYGGYVCAAANALGKVEGSVSLHELELGVGAGGDGGEKGWRAAAVPRSTAATAWPRAADGGAPAGAPDAPRAAATLQAGACLLRACYALPLAVYLLPVSNYSGDVLLLTHVQRTDMGSYYCIASNGVPPAVSRRYRVHVHFFPSIKVSNQLVGAPLGSDVVLQCYVEASPKAMNSWYRDNGDKLLESAKYHVSETTLNEYSLWMNLTIRGLERRDYGGYVCAAANALGKVEGSVSLHELELGVGAGGDGGEEGWRAAAVPRSTAATAWPRAADGGAPAGAPDAPRAAATLQAGACLLRACYALPLAVYLLR